MKKWMPSKVTILLVLLALLGAGGCASNNVKNRDVETFPVHEHDLKWYGPEEKLPEMVDPLRYPNGVFVVSQEWLIWLVQEGLVPEVVTRLPGSVTVTTEHNK